MERPCEMLCQSYAMAWGKFRVPVGKGIEKDDFWTVVKVKLLGFVETIALCVK